MRAVVVHETGGPEQLVPGDWPRPESRPGHAVVRVRAVGVCHRDVIDRRGGFPYMKKPVVPGHELCGEVVEVGDGCGELRLGARVVNLHRAACGACAMCRAGQGARCQRSAFALGLTADGCYAEYALVPAGALVEVPAGLTDESACFLMCTAGVALRGLRERAGARAGETVLVTGASGGVGIHALQVARLMGLRVLAVTSSAAKVATLREHGADDVIVSTDLVFHHDVQRATGGGVDLALDLVGSPTLNSALRSLRPMGRLVVLGNVTAARFELNPGLMILAEQTLMGSSSCSYADLEDVLRWAAAGRLRPVVDRVLPLASAAEAHRALETRGVVGRIVLTP